MCILYYLSSASALGPVLLHPPCPNALATWALCLHQACLSHTCHLHHPPPGLLLGH